MTLHSKKYHCNKLQNIIATVIILMSHLIVFGQQIEFDKVIYDFGQVLYNSETKRYIKFKNIGTDTLKITSFPSTACGCDMATIQDNKMKYAPNEEGVLIYMFDTKVPRKYHNTITIQTNSTLTHSILSVKWEVLADPIEVSNWDNIISGHNSLKNHLNLLSENGCYYTNYHYVMPTFPDLKQQLCDSIRNITVSEFDSIFSNAELFEIIKYSKNYYSRLIGFEAYSQSSYNIDSLLSIFESEYKEIMTKPDYAFPYNHHWELYNRILNIVSPKDKYYQNSNKIDLENYNYLKSISANYSSSVWFTAQSFGIVRNTIDFGNIDLSLYLKETFELRSVIVVKNVTDEILIIAPYHDANTKCDKKSYRIDPKGEVKIEFRSVVKVEQVKQPINRVIKIQNYKTKEEQLFTFKASFMNFGR